MAIRSLEPSLRMVEFRLSRSFVSQASRVCLAASFNQWEPSAHEMRRDANSSWVITVALPPGVYPYLFCVDDVWHNDPEDDGRAPSGWGNEYSLRIVR